LFPTTIKRITLRLCLLLLVLGWFAPFLFLNDTTDARFTDLTADTKWFFHAGDLPFENKAPVQSDEDWELLREAGSRQLLDGPGYYWLKINLHSQKYRDPHFFINDLLHYEVYWDGDRLFESNLVNRSPWMLEYYEWNLVSLPFGYPGESILMRVYSVDGLVTTGTIQLGNAADFIVRILHQDGDEMLFAVTFTLLCIVAALFYFYTRKKMFSYFSLLAFCAAFSSFCRTFALSLFVDAPALIYWHELMLPLGAFAFHGFFEHLVGATDRFRRTIRYFMLVFTAACFAVSIWDGQLYHSLIYFVFPALFLIMIASSLRMLYRMYHGRPGTESALMIFGYAASTFTTLVSSLLLMYPDLRIYLAERMPILTPYVRDKELPIFIGLFIFLCCMGTIVLIRENEVHRQVHEYSRELEDKNRKLEEINKLKDEFLANTSHELRTPLSGIIGITDSLLEGVAGPLNELARSNLAMVVSSGKRLSGLINDILDFSKLKHSGVSLFIQGVDVKRTAASVVSVLQPLANLKDIRMTNAIDLHLQLAVLTESLERKVLERTQALEETNRHLQAAMQETAEAMAEASVLEERNRIAFDIHNTVGHTLTACIAQMEAAKMLIIHGKTELALPKLDTSRELVSKGLNEIRESIRMLKLETSEDELSVSLLRLIRETEESAGVDIEADIAPLPPLGSTQKRTIYHALLEGFTNGIRHGKSGHFTFTLSHANGRIIFRLVNDGIPVPETSVFGFGLSAMDDNVRLIGGQLTLKPAGEHGTLLSIDIPLDWRAQARYLEQNDYLI
jgi:signal transduction histidine kinase